MEQSFHHPIHEVPYRIFSDEIHRRIYADRIPISGEIELTRRCNLRCVHCYNRDIVPAKHRDREKRGNGELSTGDFNGIVDQLAEAGCLWLLLTGGEPLVRTDFTSIYRHVRESGILVTLFTNGTLVTDRIAGVLADMPPFGVEISIYGATEETYERFTGIPGSFTRCRRGIDRIREKGLPLELKTVVTSINRHELEAMTELARSLGVAFRYDLIVSPRLDGDRSPTKYRLTPEQVVAHDIGDPDRTRSWRDFCQKYQGPVEGDGMYRCGGGLLSFHVNPFGELNLCGMARDPAYDILAGSFEEGWEEAIPKTRNRKGDPAFTCRHCSLIRFCGLCPAISIMENGTEEAPVPYLCRIAHLRAEAFGVSSEE